MALRFSLTSSSLNGLMIASTFFMTPFIVIDLPGLSRAKPMYCKADLLFFLPASHPLWPPVYLDFALSYRIAHPHQQSARLVPANGSESREFFLAISVVSGMSCLSYCLVSKQRCIFKQQKK